MERGGGDGLGERGQRQAKKREDVDGKRREKKTRMMRRESRSVMGVLDDENVSNAKEIDCM